MAKGSCEFILYDVIKCPRCNTALVNNGALGYLGRLTHQPSGCQLDGKVYMLPTVTLKEASRG